MRKKEMEMRKLVTGTLLMSLASGAFGATGLVSVESAHAVKATADRLTKALESKKMKIFARIDHAANARKNGATLRPTVLVLFGNPRIGTPWMQCSQTLGIDLPQKALIFEDAAGKVWLTYNDPQYLAERHASGDCGGVVGKVTNALANFAKAATSP